MDKQRVTYLLEQYLSAAATLQEEQELLDLLEEDTHQELFNTIQAEMIQQEMPAFPSDLTPWQKMVQNIVQIDKTTAAPLPAKVFRLRRWSAAAVILLLAGMAAYFFINRTGPSSLATRQKIIPALAIAPSDKNVLILSDGSKIFLDEVKKGKIAEEGNTAITKQDRQIIYCATGSDTASSYNVISTARGGLYDVMLPDGSHVWLNGASSIRFPSRFSGMERSVELSGEAWFDVNHAEKLPFRIHSGAITTSVLATAFDIKAYPGQRNIVVAVQHGRVRIQAGNKVLATLQKGSQLRVNADTSSDEASIDTLSVATWKQGNLLYKNESLENIIVDLRWTFRDSIAIKRPALKDARLTVSFNRNIGAQQALEIICRIIDGRLTNKNGTFLIE